MWAIELIVNIASVNMLCGILYNTCFFFTTREHIGVHSHIHTRTPCRLVSLGIQIKREKQE